MVGKRALQKDIFREIRHTFGRFFSIFAIALLGVAFFTGIRVTSPDMKESGDAFFDDMQTMDIQLLSTVGSVSYTHLDVYKRQGFWGPPMRIGTDCEIVQMEIAFAPPH